MAAEGKLSRGQMLTDPVQAKDFVAQTGVDALAIAIDTSHGAYKFTRKPTGDILAMDRIAAIHAQIPNTHLVMHGSSCSLAARLALARSRGIGSNSHPAFAYVSFARCHIPKYKTQPIQNWLNTPST